MKVLSYTVTVTAEIEDEQMTRKQWLPGGPEQATANGYGYTPQTEEVVRDTVQLFEQRVSSLDLAALVLAVNGMAAKP